MKRQLQGLLALVLLLLVLAGSSCAPKSQPESQPSVRQGQTLGSQLLYYGRQIVGRLLIFAGQAILVEPDEEQPTVDEPERESD